MGTKLNMQNHDLNYMKFGGSTYNGTEIKKLKTKRNDEVVHSVGRVLGDHTVLYKYLNPNLLGFMTVHGSGIKGAVFVYILDAVTGQNC